MKTLLDLNHDTLSYLGTFLSADDALCLSRVSKKLSLKDICRLFSHEQSHEIMNYSYKVASDFLKDSKDPFQVLDATVFYFKMKKPFQDACSLSHEIKVLALTIFTSLRSSGALPNTILDNPLACRVFARHADLKRFIQSNNQHRLLVEAILDVNPDLWTYVAQPLKKEKQLVMQVISRRPYLFLDIDPELQASKPMVLSCLKKDPRLIMHLRSNQRDDLDIMTSCITSNGKNLLFASDRLKKNKQLVIEAVKRHGLALFHADPTLKDDEDVCTHAVVQNGLSYRFCSPRIQKNPQIALRAIKQNLCALEYLPSELKKNPLISDYLPSISVCGNLTNQAAIRISNKSSTIPIVFYSFVFLISLFTLNKIFNNKSSVLVNNC